MHLPESIQLKKLAKIGEGIQGKVYLIDPEHCIKVYKKNKYFHREFECLKIGEREAFFPKMMKWGPGFMIREYIPGIELNRYLKDHPISESISSQILELFHCLERLRFRRLDVRLDHIILTSEGKLRLIDPANLMHMKESYPRRLLDGLHQVRCRREFLSYVYRHEPDLAQAWGYREKDMGTPAPEPVS